MSLPREVADAVADVLGGSILTAGKDSNPPSLPSAAVASGGTAAVMAPYGNAQTSPSGADLPAVLILATAEEGDSPAARLRALADALDREALHFGVVPGTVLRRLAGALRALAVRS